MLYPYLCAGFDQELDRARIDIVLESGRLQRRAKQDACIVYYGAALDQLSHESDLLVALEAACETARAVRKRESNQRVCWRVATKRWGHKEGTGK